MIVAMKKGLGLHHLDSVTTHYVNESYASEDFDVLVKEGQKRLVVVILGKRGNIPDPALISGCYGVDSCTQDNAEFLNDPHPELYVDLYAYVAVRERRRIGATA